MRVVSLLPSATEILDLVGATPMLVGRSHECDHPASIAHLPVLTAPRTMATTSAEIDREVREILRSSADTNASLYELDAKRLAALRPDLIVTQDLCEVCSVDLGTVRRVAESITPRPEVLSLDPVSLEDVLDDVGRVGDAVGRPGPARETLARLRERYWSAVDHVNPYVDGPEVAFLEWMDPLFAAGHWTPQLIEAAGGRHSLNAAGAKSRQVSPEELVTSRPERLIICPCGYDLAAIRAELPVLTKQPWWRDLPAVRDGAVVMVDGNQMFNRPGPRLVDAFRWLVGWINERPGVIPAGFPAESVE